MLQSVHTTNHKYLNKSHDPWNKSKKFSVEELTKLSSKWDTDLEQPDSICLNIICWYSKKTKEILKKIKTSCFYSANSWGRLLRWF